MRSLRSVTRAVAVLGATVVLASGCSGPGGKKTSDDFDEWLVENPHPGLSVTDVNMQEVLPAVGSAEITVALDSDSTTTVEEMLSATKHVCGFRPSGWNAATFNLTADRVTMLVDCADMSALGEQWQTLRILPGLERADFGDGRVDARFSSSARAREGVQLLRDAGLPVRRLTVAVLDEDGDIPWSLREDADVSDSTRQIVDRVLESHRLVWMVTTFPKTATQPERVTVVAAGSERIARLLRKEFYTEHPAWKSESLVQVVARPDR